MAESVLPEVYELLKKAVDDDIENYYITNTGTNEKGAGFLGNMCYASLKNKNTGQTKHFIIKQAFPDKQARTMANIREIYRNEIYFYETVWPKFQQFQESCSIPNPFNKVAKCFATSFEDCSEKIVLEDLRKLHFKTFDKKEVFDRRHVELVFRAYGKYHAISFAYNYLNPEGFKEISERAQHLFVRLFEEPSSRDYFMTVLTDAADSLISGEDDAVKAKFEHFVDSGAVLKKYFGLDSYKGKHPVLCHGDCWSNNMMFKYSESGEPVDMRLLDFQFIQLGSLVNDLSYCLYASASKEVLDDLNSFLKIYHTSLLEAIRNFGYHEANIITFEDLRKEWKDYSGFGFLFGLMIWKIKLTDKNDIVDFSDISKGSLEQVREQVKNIKHDKIAYREKCRNLILHMYENDLL